MSVSSCCSAELKVSYGSEGTGCYLCAKCGKPCDAVSRRSHEIDKVHELDALCESLGSQIQDLDIENAELKNENAKLKAEVWDLKRKLGERNG